MSKLNRFRTILRSLAAFPAILLLAACSGTPSPATPAPAKEKVLVIAQVGDVTTLDANMHNDTPSRNVHRNLYDSLVLRMPDGTIQPQLAESWETPDPLTWVFKFRKDVKFHNGYDFTAEDVKFSMERVMDPKNKSPRASYWQSLESLAVPDPYTLVLKTKTPYPLTLSRMSGTNDVVSKRYFQEVGEEKAIKEPVGTGPFKFKEWVKDEQVVLEVFKDYWGGRPKIDRLIFRSIPEASTRIAELVNGKVHIATNLNIEQMKDLEKQPGIKPIVGESTRVEFLVLDNQKAGPLQNQKARQALNYAVDRDGLLKAFLGGYGTPIGQVVSAPMFGYNKEVTPYPYDAVKAKQLLTEAGFPNGFNIDFDCPQANKEICEAIVLQFDKVGVKAKLQFFEATTLAQRVNTRQISPMFFHSWLGLTVDIEGTVSPLILSTARQSWFTDPSVDAQIKQGAATVDNAKRTAIYNPLAVELKEKAPWLFLWQGVDLYGTSDKLMNWTPRPDSYLLFKEADLAN